MMTSAQVVETSVNVTSNSPSQDYTHPDDHNLPNYDMTPGFKPFTVLQNKGSNMYGLGLEGWRMGQVTLNFNSRGKILCMQGSGVCALCCWRVLNFI